MSFLGISGGFNPLQAVSQLALGVATGGSSLIMQMAMQLASQVVKNVLAQVGAQLGLPPAIVNGAIAAFEGATGNIGGAIADGASSIGGMLGQLQSATNANSTQMGEIEGKVDTLQDLVQKMVLDQAQQAGQTSTDEDGGRGSARTRMSSGSKGGGSWLMALAEVLGKKLNQAADQMKADADALDWKDPAEATKFSAETQEFSMLFTTLSTVIKSVGEGEKAMASRQ